VLLYTFVFGAATCWLLGMPPWRLAALGWDGATWAGLCAVVVVATVLPFGLYFWGMARLEPTRAVLTLSMEAVFAAALAWLCLGEALAPLQILGGALVLGAVAWLNAPAGAGRSRRGAAEAPRPPPPPRSGRECIASE
jgi:drug/metabolite transporter (DMT)-like permease